MYLWQANLGRGVSTDEFRRNLRRVLNAGGPRAVFCFQEIDEADGPEEMDILSELTDRTHYIVGSYTAVPILVPNHLDSTFGAVTPACKGLAKYTPNRVITEVTLALGPNLHPTILNTHLPLNRPATFTRRREVRKALRRRATARQSTGGIWVADTNTHLGWPRIAKGERSVINAGIDKAKAWAPPGRKVVVTDRRTVNLTIDGHNAHGARIMWRREDA
jgi:hypothetical protein